MSMNYRIGCGEIEMLLQLVKAQNDNEVFDSAKQRLSQEQARRKQISRAHEGFLNNMHAENDESI